VRLRPRLGDALVVRPPHLRAPLWLLLLLWGSRRLAGALAWLLRRPRRLGALVAIVGVWTAYARVGWAPFAIAAGVIVVALTVWPVIDRSTFARFVRLPARGRRRQVVVYSRSWENATTTAALSIRRGHVEHVPELLRVRSTDLVDRARVRMLPGQTVLDYAAATDQLAQTFGVLDVRARQVPGRRHEVELLALVRDPLDRVVELPEPANEPDLRALPVGIREDGAPLTLPVLGSHLLVAGVTGAGKGSAVWATIAALGPAIRERRVLVWAIDPKGGAELIGGAPLFDRFVFGGTTAAGVPWQTAIADLLDEAVAAMQARLANMRARGARAHRPTVDEPLLLIVVDEIASITAYVTDPALRRRIENALSLLLSQGRAPAVSVLAATQDPRKETLGFRDLIPLRVALRTAEPVADLILGAGARARGAHSDRIDPTLPGVGYVLDEGQAEPVRVRFAYADDEAIRRLADEFRPVPVIALALYGAS
jgi:S-DNA-T family DNA segregation ATPase FtsK/SpoIIIE